MKLETERLVLRDLEEKDIDNICKNVNELEVSKYLAVVPYPYKKSDAEWWANNCIKESQENPRENYNLGVEYNGEIIGAIGLTKIDYFVKKATFGLWLGKDYWRKGIMTEASNVLFDFAFNELGLNRIDSAAYVNNESSNKLHKKLGFVYEGRKRQDSRSKATGEFHDSNIYGLLKKDWLKNNKPYKKD